MLANTWIFFAAATPLQQALADAFEESLCPYEGYSTYVLRLPLVLGPTDILISGAPAAILNG